MFMEAATMVIGVAIVLMVAYVVVVNVKAAMNTTDATANTKIAETQTTVFNSITLLGVGLIVLAAFTIIRIFA